MKRVLFGWAVVGLAAAPLGCNSFEPTQSIVLLVDRIDAPASISAGSPLTVVVTVIVGGCRTFERFAVRRDASGASMIALGRDGATSNNMVCTDDARPEPHSYQFDPPLQNQFTVQVQRLGLEPLTTTVQVQ